jgi:hypothetical protein
MFQIIYKESKEKQDNRSNRGLRNLSLKVKKIVEEK